MNTASALLSAVEKQVKAELKPLVKQIDTDGFYPQEYLQNLGALGGFAALGSVQEGGQNLGLFTQIEVLQKIGAACGATSFSAWCQSACAWYLKRSLRPLVREQYLSSVLQGKRLAGTAMSNTVKHLSGIEQHKLKASKTPQGYVINGSLPWVSNIGEEHIWAAAAQVDEQQFIMFIVEGKQAGVSLKPCPEFCALEGTRTLNVRLQEVLIKEHQLLADTHEFDEFLQAIKPGFILLQMGIGAGIIQGCLKIIQSCNLSTGHINAFLNDDFATLQQQYQSLLEQTKDLAGKIEQQRRLNQADLLAVLELRLQGSELSLKAAQSAALHAGAKGYLKSHAAQRRSREAMFVAIVTPAIKQLQKDIFKLKQQLEAA